MLSMVGSISYAHQLVLFRVGLSNWSSGFHQFAFCRPGSRGRPVHPPELGLWSRVLQLTMSLVSWLSPSCALAAVQVGHILHCLPHCSPLHNRVAVRDLCARHILCFLHQLLAFVVRRLSHCWTLPWFRALHAGVFLVCIPAAQPLEGRKGRLYTVHRLLESQDRVDLHLQICTLLFRCTAHCFICSVACTPVCLYAQRSLSFTAFTA